MYLSQNDSTYKIIMNSASFRICTQNKFCLSNDANSKYNFLLKLKICNFHMHFMLMIIIHMKNTLKNRLYSNDFISDHCYANLQNPVSFLILQYATKSSKISFGSNFWKHHQAETKFSYFSRSPRIHAKWWNISEIYRKEILMKSLYR